MQALNTEAAWNATLGELELQMTKATFNTWLKDAQLLTCENNEYVIGVRNDAHAFRSLMRWFPFRCTISFIGEFENKAADQRKLLA